MKTEFEDLVIANLSQLDDDYATRAQRGTDVLGCGVDLVVSWLCMDRVAMTRTALQEEVLGL